MNKKIVGGNGRVRAANFTAEEAKLLLQLCNVNSKVLENKKTDGTTNAEKTRAWEEIEKKFNASAIGSTVSYFQILSQFYFMSYLQSLTIVF